MTDQIDRLKQLNGELCAEINRQEKRIRELESLLDGEIVRCRDCAYMSERHYRDMLGFGRETIVYRCDYFWNADELPEVDPDGFCAWGVKRKEGGDDWRDRLP